MRGGALSGLRNWRLRKKLIVSFVALVMLPVLLFSGYSAWHSQRSMEAQVEERFSDSIYQVGMRISHQFESYNAALRYLAMNRQVAQIFEDRPESYYRQYSDMTEILEPTLLMIEQLSPAMDGLGIYTGNHALKERNGSVQYLEQLSQRRWIGRLAHRHKLQWFAEDGELMGLAQLMRHTSQAPESFAYVSLRAEAVFDVELESLRQYGYYIEDGGERIHSRQIGLEGLEEARFEAVGVQRFGGRRYLVARQPVAALGWTLCVYCPYDALGIDIRDTLKSLLALGLGSLALLSLVGVWIADSISRRVKRLNDSMTRVEAGQLDMEVQTCHRDEIGELTVHFNHMVAALRSYIQTNYENRLLLREAELKALQAQINPHFLYNSLSLINWMAIEQEDMEISEIACALSNFYRTVLNQGESVLRVRDEIRNVEAYLKIQSAMHSGSFAVELDVETQIMDCEIIGVILQPIVENAIEHGIDQRREKDGARIAITGRREADALVFAVSDNGPGMTQAQFEQSVSHSSRSYGLKNVQDRLRIAYGDAYGLSLEANAPVGARVVIRVPFAIPEKRDINLKNEALNS